MTDKQSAEDPSRHRTNFRERARWRNALYAVIFRADGRWGRGFDVGLMIAITLSVLAVMLDSVPEIATNHRRALRVTEWVFTIAFTAEYLLRLASAKHWKSYAFSFFGVVDLLSTIPTYLQFLLPGGQYLLVIRVLRLLRMFRILKMGRHLREADLFINALRASRPKIIVFIFTILALVLVMGTIIYLIEGEENGFRSIPDSVYWAIVTITTVGYGDISPQTWIGKAVAALCMLIGWAILAVPTGIVGVELARSASSLSNRSTPNNEKHNKCPECHATNMDEHFKFCPLCGEPLIVENPPENPDNS